MDSITVFVFALVYLGMLFGGVPGLAVDRTGVALLGAIALLACKRITPQAAWNAVDVPTIGLLFGLMVLSAQFRLAGLYSAITHRVAAARLSPGRLLGLVIGVAAGLSALLANDIVCLAMTPLLIEGCLRRGLRPLPFLLGLACGANIGSAATLIGNPQNMLIGQTLGLSFSGYLIDGVAPAVTGCALTWGVLAWQFRRRWTQAAVQLDVAAQPFDAWQCGKGVALLLGLMLAFVFAPWPREVTALGAAGVLLLSRRLRSVDLLGLIDWQLLVLFAGLFIVNHALQASGLLETWVERLAASGINVRQPAWLFAVTAILSNIVSNVPAVMLLLPTADHPQAGATLALASTFAGNLLIVGSIANIIVVQQAERLGLRITWREHARTGVPVTLATLAIAAVWLALRA